MKLKPRCPNYQPEFKIKKDLNLTSLLATISQRFSVFPDQRRETHRQYLQHDVLMAALSCMFFQQPSWLQYQQQLQDGLQENNLENLFHVAKLPKDSQCRNILDAVDSEYYRPIFKSLFEQLRQDKQLERFRLPFIDKGLFYVAMDGSLYHSSKKVRCDCCLTKNHSNGTVTYQHQVLQGAVMHPDCRQVLPLMPEPILNTDGQKKQDCEHNAAKRFLTQLRKDHPHLPLMIGGDGLFSDGPIIRHLSALKMHYLFTCKPDDHTYLMEWLEAYEQWGWQEHIDEKDVIHRYRWRNQVPLSAQKDAPQVNFFEYQMIKKGAIVYKNSWVTDIEIRLSNVFRLVKTGRCRWKIENECFNTLKNQGYELKHNFGHGKKNLSHNMYLSTLLAFYLHQILELCDEAFQLCRIRFGSKRNLWERMRQMTCQFIVPDWYWLLGWCLDPKHEQFTLVEILKESI